MEHVPEERAPRCGVILLQKRVHGLHIAAGAVGAAGIDAEMRQE